MSYRAGFVGLIGLPNAGKSTLVNALVGEKVGIVTRKPQTTRQRVTGVFTDDDGQVALVDTPGRIRAESGLNHFLQKELEAVIAESDALLVVLNLDAPKKEALEDLISMAEQSRKNFAVFVNKVDLGLEPRRQLLLEQLKSLKVPVIEGSARARRDKLVASLGPVLKQLVPESPAPLFDESVYTTQTARSLVAEIIREKCFEYLHQEIPYGLAVQVLKYDESGPTLKIHGQIIVNKENHRGMVVGQQAKTIKTIGMASRRELEKLLQRKIFLDLHVKARQNWVKRDSMMKEFGYVLPQ